MAGHSKWAQIKRQKGVADARRGQLFTKLGREIVVAVRQGGPDPEANFRLRLAIQRARDHNMPNETIERAIKRAAGATDGAQLQEVVYEGYGPGGAAILIEALTDNKNRTVAELRNAFSKLGGNLGEAGSVAWMFETRGVINLTVDPERAEEIALIAIDAGAQDFKIEGTAMEIYTKPEDLERVRKALEDAGATVAEAQVSRVPTTTVALDAKRAEQTLRLIDRLEELDDVQRVYFNAEFPDEVLAAYA